MGLLDRLRKATPLEPDYGYRIRQPGISESVIDSHGGRGTGHFGTGVYFVSRPDHPALTPPESVYRFPISPEAKLYRPRDHDTAHDLHRGLQWINRAVHAPNGYQPHFGDPMDDAAMLQRADTHLVRGGILNATERIPDAVRFAREQLAELEASRDLRYTNPDLYWSMVRQSPSGSTRLMQSLGYDGVDVRHLPSLDNTEYGSVLYQPHAQAAVEGGVPHYGSVDSPRVGAQTRQQLLELAAQHPDTSRVVHEFPDGWSVRQPTTHRDIHRTGELMGNCMSLTNIHNGNPAGPYDKHPDWPTTVGADGTTYPADIMTDEEYHRILNNLDVPAENSNYRYLVDPHGLPRVSWWESLYGGDNIHEALGRHNSAPKPEYLQRLQQYADSTGLRLGPADYGDLPPDEDDAEDQAPPEQRQGSVTPAVYYHVAPADDRADVQQHGIDWNRRDQTRDWRSAEDEEYYPHGNYLTTDLDRAREHARVSGGDIYTVTHDGRHLIPDPDEQWDGTSYYTPVPIAPDRLSLLEPYQGSVTPPGSQVTAGYWDTFWQGGPSLHPAHAQFLNSDPTSSPILPPTKAQRGGLRPAPPQTTFGDLSRGDKFTFNADGEVWTHNGCGSQAGWATGPTWTGDRRFGLHHPVHSVLRAGEEPAVLSEPPPPIPPDVREPWEQTLHEFAADPRTMWHGTQWGSLGQGSVPVVHLGGWKAAHEALGSRGSKETAAMHPLRIVGPMHQNTWTDQHAEVDGDGRAPGQNSAEGRMLGMFKRGIRPRQGFYYTNGGEGTRYINGQTVYDRSAIVPHPSWLKSHQDFVNEAIAEGEPVPDHVRAEYTPDKGRYGAQGLPSMEELAPFRDDQECYFTAEGIEHKWPHLKQDAGFYAHPSRGPGDHSWNIAPDGTIVDMTATQHDYDEDQLSGRGDEIPTAAPKHPEIIPPDHPYYPRYVSWTRHVPQAQSLAHDLGYHYDDEQAQYPCPQCRGGDSREERYGATGQVMYHVAPRSRREEIASTGLRGGLSRDRVYAWGDLTDAKDFALRNPNQDVWAIDASGLEPKLHETEFPLRGHVVNNPELAHAQTSGELMRDTNTYTLPSPIGPEHVNHLGHFEWQGAQPVWMDADQGRFGAQGPFSLVYEQARAFKGMGSPLRVEEIAKRIMREGNILDPIKDELDGHVWEDPAAPEPHLKDHLRSWILSTVFEVLHSGGYNGMSDWAKLVLTGSLTTYQYSHESDCDISIFVDSDQFPEWSRAEMIGLMIEGFDGVNLPGTSHELQVYVVPKQIKPADLYQYGLRSGYDLEHDAWIIPPDKNRVHDVEHEENESYTNGLIAADKMERLLRYEPNKAILLYQQVHRRRMADQKAGKGDFSDSNVVYKMLANRGLLDEIGKLMGKKLGSTSPWSKLAADDPVPDYFPEEWAPEPEPDTIPWAHIMQVLKQMPHEEAQQQAEELARNHVEAQKAATGKNLVDADGNDWTDFMVHMRARTLLGECHRCQSTHKVVPGTGTLYENGKPGTLGGIPADLCAYCRGDEERPPKPRALTQLTESEHGHPVIVDATSPRTVQVTEKRQHSDWDQCAQCGNGRKEHRYTEHELAKMTQWDRDRGHEASPEDYADWQPSALNHAKDQPPVTYHPYVEGDREPSQERYHFDRPSLDQAIANGGGTFKDISDMDWSLAHDNGVYHIRRPSDNPYSDPGFKVPAADFHTALGGFA